MSDEYSLLNTTTTVHSPLRGTFKASASYYGHRAVLDLAVDAAGRENGASATLTLWLHEDADEALRQVDRIERVLGHLRSHLLRAKRGASVGDHVLVIKSLAFGERDRDDEAQLAKPVCNGGLITPERPCPVHGDYGTADNEQLLAHYRESAQLGV